MCPDPLNHVNLLWLDKVAHAKQPQRLPVVLTRTEVQVVLTRMSGTYDLMAHLPQCRALFDDDSRSGRAPVYLPDALERKYPNTATDWAWQYIFPAGNLSINPRSGVER